MFKTLALAAVALAGSTGSAQAAPVAPDEAALARSVQDRTAGKPRDCIRLSRSGSIRIVARTAVIFESGATLYVNRPAAGADSLSDSTILVTRSPNGEICDGEAVALLDAATGMERGLIFLGKFVPYRRVNSLNGFPSANDRPAGYR